MMNQMTVAIKNSAIFGPLFKHLLLDFDVHDVNQSVIFSLSFSQDPDVSITATLPTDLEQFITDEKQLTQTLTELQKQNVLALLLHSLGNDGREALNKCAVIYSDGTLDPTGISRLLGRTFARIKGLDCSIKHTETGVSVCFEWFGKQHFVNIPSAQIQAITAPVLSAEGIGLDMANYAARQWLIGQFLGLFWAMNGAPQFVPDQIKRLRSEDRVQMKQLLDKVRAQKVSDVESTLANLTV